jgi:hypothetical protein
MNQLYRYDIEPYYKGNFYIGYVISVYHLGLFSYYIHKVYKTKLAAIHAMEGLTQ